MKLETFSDESNFSKSKVSESAGIKVGEFWTHYKNPNDIIGYMVRGFYKCKIVLPKDNEECLLYRNKITGDFVLLPTKIQKGDVEERFVNEEFEKVVLGDKGEVLKLQIDKNAIKNNSDEIEMVLYKKPGENVFWLRPIDEFAAKFTNATEKMKKEGKVIDRIINDKRFTEVLKDHPNLLERIVKRVFGK